MHSLPEVSRLTGVVCRRPSRESVLGQGPRQAAPQPPLLPRVTAGWESSGSDRECVPELTARGPLKIVLPGAARLCLAPERGEGRAGRVLWEGGASVLPSFCPHAGVPGASWEPDPGGGAGGSLGGAGTAGCRQEGMGAAGLGWVSGDWPLGIVSLGSHPKSCVAQLSSSSADTDELPCISPGQPGRGHCHTW